MKGVLGVDPSTADTGWAVVTPAQGGRYEVIASGSISVKGRDLQEKLDFVYGEIKRLLLSHPEAGAVACEDQFYAKNVRTLTVLSCVKGAVMLAARHCGVGFHSYPPTTAKFAVTGRGNASKEEVLAMVERLTGRKPESFDESDAISIAIAHIDRNRTG